MRLTQASGMRTAWIARGEYVLVASVPEPDMRVADLAGLAEAVLRITNGR